MKGKSRGKGRRETLIGWKNIAPSAAAAAAGKRGIIVHVNAQRVAKSNACKAKRSESGGRCLVSPPPAPREPRSTVSTKAQLRRIGRVAEELQDARTTVGLQLGSLRHREEREESRRAPLWIPQAKEEEGRGGDTKEQVHAEKRRARERSPSPQARTSPPVTGCNSASLSK